MRLRPKLILSTMLFTFVLTMALSLVFLSEVLRERIEQTDSSNSILVHQILMATRHALEHGIASSPKTLSSPAAFDEAIADTLRNDEALTETMNSIIRYAPTVQDAYVSDAAGKVLTSTDPAMIDSGAPHRRPFSLVMDASVGTRRHTLFGAPEVLDVSLPLNRNGKPFLVAHLGVRSTFLKQAYAPWLHDATLIAILALGSALLVAALLTAVALRPIEQISRRLDELSARSGEQAASSSEERKQDAMQRVDSTISRIDQQIRSSEQTQTALATNLNSMLQTLKDGVLLFTADLRVAVASDAVSNFVSPGTSTAPGTLLTDIFPPGTAIGRLLSAALGEGRNVRAQSVQLPDGRTIELSLDYFQTSGMGALLTLHDLAAQEELEREIEVSRRLASIGRLTAGVGHEVKNPINAMVVHLELLRSKLKLASGADGAQRHVDVLASEMGRLDRVVQTLADFTRPIEPDLREQEVRPIVQAVIQLVSAEAEQKRIRLAITDEGSMRVVADAELVRQALLNIMLNAMQAMPNGGIIHVDIARDRNMVAIAIRDTGTGIPLETLGRIFDLYFTTKQSGSGIGLAMTYRLVQLHGGTITVDSDADPASSSRGTLFTVRLPLATRQQASSAEVISA